MAVSKPQVQILWPASAVSISILAGGTQDSEVFAFDASSIDALLHLKAKNNGTPVDGDQVEFFIKYTGGDPDADPDTADEYDTDNHAEPLRRLDTNSDDPAVATVAISTAAKSGKVFVKNNASSNSVTVSAIMTEVVNS